MKGKIQRWGNSLALRIPKTFADEAHVVAGSAVDIELKGGKLIVLPISTKPTLKSLLANVTADNIHVETQTGEAIGREVW